MNFLIDQSVSPLLAEWLRSADGGAHDAVHARERGLSRATDPELFEIALSESRVLVTADLDFARIIALSRLDGPGLILFRAGNMTDVQMLSLLRRVMAETTPESLPRSVVVIDEHAMRIATLPIRPGG